MKWLVAGPGRRGVPWVGLRPRGVARDGGFTLIEMMFTLTVVLFVAAGTVGVLIAGSGARANNEGYTKAVQLAQDQIERVRTLGWRRTGVYTASHGSPNFGDAGYAPSGENLVLFSGTAPAMPSGDPQKNQIDPTFTVSSQGLTFTVRTYMAWGDLSGLGATTPATGGTGWSYKSVRVVVTWTRPAPRGPGTVTMRTFIPADLDQQPPPGIPVVP